MNAQITVSCMCVSAQIYFHFLLSVLNLIWIFSISIETFIPPRQTLFFFNWLVVNVDKRGGWFLSKKEKEKKKKRGRWLLYLNFARKTSWIDNCLCRFLPKKNLFISIAVKFVRFWVFYSDFCYELLSLEKKCCKISRSCREIGTQLLHSSLNGG